MTLGPKFVTLCYCPIATPLEVLEVGSCNLACGSFSISLSCSANFMEVRLGEVNVYADLTWNE